MIRILRDNNIAVNRFRLVFEETEGVSQEDIERLESITNDISKEDMVDVTPLALALTEVQRKAEVFSVSLYVPERISREQVLVMFTLFNDLNTKAVHAELEEKQTVPSSEIKSLSMLDNIKDSEEEKATEKGEVVSLRKKATQKVRAAAQRVRNVVGGKSNKDEAVKEAKENKASEDGHLNGTYSKLSPFNKKLVIITAVKRSFA